MTRQRTQYSQDESTGDRRVIQIGLFIIAGISTFAAVATGIWQADVHENAAKFLALAIVALIIRDIEKITIGDTTIQRFREDVKRLETKVDVIEDAGLLPGRSGRMVELARTAAKEREWEIDPNKDRFNGSPRSNGRILSAKITPIAGQSSAVCKVRLRVESEDPAAAPLTGRVIFHLHPTFRRYAKYPVPVKGGVAEDEITSWGAFTIGAEADEGRTKLELDLADVPGGTGKFYAE